MKKQIFLLLPLALLYAQKTATIQIKGMTCPLCTTAIKKSLKKVEGVKSARVRLNTKRAKVQFDDDLNTSILLDAIAKTGYQGTIISVESR